MELPIPSGDARIPNCSGVDGRGEDGGLPLGLTPEAIPILNDLGGPPTAIQCKREAKFTKRVQEKQSRMSRVKNSAG